VRVAVRLGGAEVTTAELRYRVRGGTEIRLPMALADDGAWVAEIAAQRTGRQVTYAIRVGLADGRAVFFPPDNWTHPFSYRVAGVSLVPELGGDLVINELMADNATTIADEAGEFDDWVELYNRGDEPISLAGLFLSDDPEDPWAYALPDIELEPGAHLLIWCDNDPEQGPLHAPFRFDRDGEQVALASAGALLDVVEFGAQVADVSWARAIDGGEVWMACVPASPGAPNAWGEVPPTPTCVARPARRPIHRCPTKASFTCRWPTGIDRPAEAFRGGGGRGGGLKRSGAETSGTADCPGSPPPPFRRYVRLDHPDDVPAAGAVVRAPSRDQWRRRTVFRPPATSAGSSCRVPCPRCSGCRRT